MGKVTGFMEFDRLDRDYAPVDERTQHYKEFLIPLENKELKELINQENISELSSTDIFKIDLNDTKKNEILNKLKEQYDNASLDIKE